MMTENEKLKALKELEPVIDYNVRRYFNYRMHDYQDLMQEARMIVWEKLDKYNQEAGSLSTFCQTLIRNNLTLITIKIYKVWDKTCIDSEKVESVAEESEDKVDKYFKRLVDITHTYCPRFSDLELKFICCLIDRKSFKTIEQELGITSNHRTQLAFQVKKKIQSILEEEGI